MIFVLRVCLGPTSKGIYWFYQIHLQIFKKTDTICINHLEGVLVCPSLAVCVPPSHIAPHPYPSYSDCDLEIYAPIQHLWDVTSVACWHRERKWNWIHYKWPNDIAAELFAYQRRLLITLSKQFGPRLGRTFRVQIVWHSDGILELIFSARGKKTTKKKTTKKKQRMTKSMKNYPVCNELSH